MGAGAPGASWSMRRGATVALLLTVSSPGAACAGEQGPARAGEPGPSHAGEPGPAATAGHPIVGRFGGGEVGFWAGVVRVAGAAAADLHAPNAAVARVRAEGVARLVAARRLAAAVALVPAARLGCAARPAQPVLDGAAARARAEPIEWSSDGSVSLVLQGPLAGLLAAPGAGGGAGSGGAGGHGRGAGAPGRAPR